MRSASPAFVEACGSSHTIVARFDVLYAGAVIGTVDWDDWNVSYDRRQLTMGRLTAVFPTPGRRPGSADDLLHPWGRELRLWVGIDGVLDANGDTEMVPLGTFRIETSEFEDGISYVEAFDRWAVVERARYEDDTQVAAGTNYVTAITGQLLGGYPSLETLFDSTTLTTPLLTFAAQSDRREAVQGMASSIGRWVYLDGLGRARLLPEPSADTSPPVATVAEGDGTPGFGTLRGTRTRLTARGVYNRTIASSANSSLGDVYRGVATDNNSLTGYDSPFGRAPLFYASPFIASTAQANLAAATRMAGKAGVQRQVVPTATPNWLIEVGDVIAISKPSEALNEIAIVEAVSLAPFDAMQIDPRSGGDIE